jgi:hypothetical protein
MTQKEYSPEIRNSLWKNGRTRMPFDFAHGRDCPIVPFLFASFAPFCG